LRGDPSSTAIWTGAGVADERDDAVGESRRFFDMVVDCLSKAS
jgi:hypothetical protein